MTKRFINIVIDSLNPQSFAECLKLNKIPALKFLVENGRMTLSCVSSFPTMTPVAAASIATGTMVNQHHLPGFIWYDQEQRRVINYGATGKAVFNLGVYRVIEDFLFEMNKRHINPAIPTIFELLEEQGINTGSVNFFCFRGMKKHEVRFPLSMQIAAGKRLKGEVYGPSHLVLGKLVNPDGHNLSFLSWEKKFGFNDFFSFHAAMHMLKKNKDVPRFMIIYFPDNDSFSHRHGPLSTEASIKQVDQYIGRLLSIFGSWQQAIRENIFLVLGDHSQSQIFANGLAFIDLEKILSDFAREIIICPNERMAYLHLLNYLNKSGQKEIISMLAGDGRIGIISWREDSRFFAWAGGNGKQLVFWPGTQVTDETGTGWDFTGDLEVIDGSLESRITGYQLVCRDYPVALTRLAGILEYLPENTIVLSANPGYEFKTSNAPTHYGGGSHGSLHQNDSLVPLIISGTELWPEFASITSLMNLWCRHYGLNNPALEKSTTGHPF